MAPWWGSWDQQSPAALRRQRDALVREQVQDAVAPFSPYWRDLLAARGLRADDVTGVARLPLLPAVGERDVCPDGDPAGAAALVLQGGETGYLLHAPGPQLRKALVRRLLAPSAYRRQLDEDTRATSYVYGGLSVTFPIASTRSDLDILARVGARAWSVLGLGPRDVLVSGLADGSTTPEQQALQFAALGGGSPAFLPGDETLLAETLRLVEPTVLALPSGAAAAALSTLASDGARLSGLRTLLLVGAPSESEQAAAVDALVAAGVEDAVVLGFHVPSGERLPWVECRASARADRQGVEPPGYHSWPDLQVVELVDPATGEPARAGGGGEVVVTQLGLRGSALLRWRTGDLVGEPLPELGPCPACGRVLPRVPAGLARAALVPAWPTAADAGARLDLRSVGGALAGRPDLLDWRIEIRRSARDGAELLLVHVLPKTTVDSGDAAVAAARDVRAASGVLPDQVVVAEAEAAALPEQPGLPPGERLVGVGVG